jgi:Flp pilus assembly protein TadG
MKNRTERSIYDCERASAAVEFAIALPILVMIVVAIVEYAQVVNIGTKLHNAARAGAQYALLYPADSSGIQNAATSSTSDSTMTASVGRFCSCGSSSTSATGYNSSWSTCTGGTLTCTGTSLRYYISVSTSQTFTPSPNIIYRGFGGSFAMHGYAVVEVQ